MPLKESLERILELNQAENIQQPDDIVTDDDKDIMFNILNSLRNLTETLDQLDQPSLSLFTKDFFQLFVESIDIAQSTFLDPTTGDPKWTDFRSTNIGTFFLSVLATNLDKHYFLTDRMFAQLFFQTVIQFTFFYMSAVEERFKP